MKRCEPQNSNTSAGKVGRNDPCPCGSGKKYKKCHGAPAPPPQSAAPQPSQSPNRQPITRSIPTGMPGMLQYVGFMVKLPASPDPHVPIQGGGEGFYKVVFTLARPGYPLTPEGQFHTFETLQGDSHLAIAKPAYSIAADDDVEHVILQAQTEDGYFELYGKPNGRGFLAQITAEPIHAADAQDARTKASRALASSLSNISIQLDMPLAVYQADMIELKTGNRFMSIISPYQERPMLVAPTGTLSKEFRAYASLYREALNSNTPVFQFLCYFKIIEGIQERRKRLIAEAVAGGRTPPRTPTQIVPTEEADFLPWLNAIHHVGRDWDYITLESIFVPEARGKKFNRIIDDYLRPIRVHVAHAVLDSGELALSADEEMDVRQVYKWLSLTKCVVRHMLKSDFPQEFLPYLTAAGEVVPKP